MASQLKNITILGASGSVGKIILDGLLQAPQFNVTVLSRASSDSTFPNGINVRKTDFSDSDLISAFEGKDAVISVLGAAGFGEQKKLIDAAIAAGVKRFFPSEFSANTLSPAVLELLPLFGQKKEVLAYLKEKESSEFSWTAIFPALLFDWGLENGFLGYDIAGRTATIWDDGSRVFTLTNTSDLGRAVVSALEKPNETSHKNLYIASVETSQKQILTALEAATGTKWDVTSTTSEKKIEEAFEKLGKGDFSGALTLVRATSWSNKSGLRANYAKEEVLANDLLGLKLGTVDETVARVVKK